ncbi:PAS domain-containing sensor histidine kinase [Methanolobus sp. WCC1]|uniref:sensor histidine kinase n=1 Tax=unclassified Methanolobus TaxID=2629569 RepID=UPI003249D8E2
MNTSRKIILASLVFGLFFWLFDSSVDYLFYYNGTFENLLINKVPGHEIYIRSTVFLLFLIFGIVLADSVSKINTANHELKERVKELDCLYEISCIIRDSSSLKDAFEKIVEIIPTSWQYPEITSSRIVFADLEIRSSNFVHSDIKLSHDITIDGEIVGSVEVFYLENREMDGNDPFVKEEYDLIEGIVRDITQFIVLKKKEEKILESEIKLRTLVNSIPDLVALKNPDGTYIKCNMKYEAFIGADKKDIIGKNDYIFLSKELADDFRRHEQEIIESGELTLEEKELFFVDGHSEIVDIIRGPIYNPDGSLMGLLFVGRDVTRRKEIEMSLFKDKLLAEELSEVKGKFLANMSHELRTPLSSIIGFSEVLEEKNYGELNDEQHKFVMNIRNSGNHLLELINNILDNAKIESGQMPFEPISFDLRDLIDEISMLVEPMAKAKPIDLVSTVEFDHFEVYADKLKMKQIMYNLISNAIKFTPVNGKIFINSRMNDGEVLISVTDTGIGIPANQQRNIFEPFKQAGTRDYYKGTGLGLSIVKQFVEMHGGKIRVESEVGNGSTFTVTLPVTSS